MRHLGKGLRKLFKAAVNYISQALKFQGQSGSEVSYFIPEPRKSAEVTRISEDIKKPWIKANLKQIQNLINNKTFLVQEPEKGEPLTPFMDIYKAKIQSDGSLDKLKLIIVIRGDLQNKYLIGNTWLSTSPKRNQNISCKMLLSSWKEYTSQILLYYSYR